VLGFRTLATLTAFVNMLENSGRGF
jgi:hypothetical protein